uniref:Uncharacterized protein n=1 Tax=Cryptomonas curvata TaxID=233186 RepID=A0A7S0MF68_9CRYP
MSVRELNSPYDRRVTYDGRSSFDGRVSYDGRHSPIPFSNHRVAQTPQYLNTNSVVSVPASFSGAKNVHDCIRESQMEISRLSQRLQMLDASVPLNLSEFEQARNEEFRKIWVDEETRVKKISAESRSRVDDVRNRMLNGLERIDAANQEMLAVMQDMILMDNEILSLASKF